MLRALGSLLRQGAQNSFCQGRGNSNPAPAPPSAAPRIQIVMSNLNEKSKHYTAIECKIKKKHEKTFPDLKERGVIKFFSVIDFLDKIIMDSSLIFTFDTENPP